jgi:hypothetical protein
MFKLYPTLAAQVQEAYIALPMNTSFNRRSLLTLFPNVRVIKVDSKESARAQSGQFRYPIVIGKATADIVPLTDFSCCELACQLLDSNLSGRLKYLVLRPGNYSSKHFSKDEKIYPF